MFKVRAPADLLPSESIFCDLISRLSVTPRWDVGCGEAKGLWESSVLSAQSHFEPISALINKIYL